MTRKTPMKNKQLSLLAAIALTLVPVAVPLTLTACAGILPIVVTASAIASEVIAWVDRIDAFLRSTAVVPPDVQRKIDGAVERARAAATALQHAARAGEQADRGGIESAKRDTLAAVSALLDLVAPFGVRTAPDGIGEYGIASGEDGPEMIVPTAHEMVGL